MPVGMKQLLGVDVSLLFARVWSAMYRRLYGKPTPALLSLAGVVGTAHSAGISLDEAVLS